MWLVPLGLVALAVVLYFTWPTFQSFVNEAYQVLTSGVAAYVVYDQRFRSA